MKLNDFVVPGYDRYLSVSYDFDSEDLSGETSSTEEAHKGIKAKRLDINFILPYKEVAALANFLSVAEAKDQNTNDLLVYTITGRTANALNIRQVKFSGRVGVSELREINAWRISFSLKEHISVPEKKEERLSNTTDTATDSTDTPPDIEATTETETLSSFEKLLKYVDGVLE